MYDEIAAGRERDRDVGRPVTEASYGSESSDSTASTTAKAGAQAAAEGAKDVAQTAKDEARNVADEVSTQARRVAGDLREQVRDRAYQQHSTMVGGLRRAADELRDMTDHRESSPATNLVTNLADRTRRLAEQLEKTGPEGVLAEVQEFARRRPGTFLLTAAAAGFVVGRVGKSVFSAPNSPLSGGSERSTTAEPGTSGEMLRDDGGWSDPTVPPVTAEGTVYASGSAADEPPRVAPVPPAPVPTPPVPPSISPGTRS